MRIEFRIIKDEDDLTIGKEKQRLIEIIINKLSTASNRKLYEVINKMEG